MANIENIVKIMNFHSLVRIDNSKRNAEKYFLVEQELLNMMSQILDNKNLNIDKRIIKPNKNGDVLDIYIGNDYGFCGNFNTLVYKELVNSNDSKKIVIGKKIFTKGDESIILSMTKEDFYQDFSPIEKIIRDYIMNENLKEVNVIYNRYYHVGDIKFEKQTIYPISHDFVSEETKAVDFIIETDVKNLLKYMVVTYLGYEIKILETYSWASENVMREQITHDCLKKIKEINEEKKIKARKQKKSSDLKKEISSYRLE